MKYLLTGQKETNENLLKIIPSSLRNKFLSIPVFKLKAINNIKIDLNSFQFIIFTSNFAIKYFLSCEKIVGEKTIIFLSEELKNNFLTFFNSSKKLLLLTSFQANQKSIIKLIKKKRLFGNFLFPCSQKADVELDKFFESENNRTLFRYECYKPIELNFFFNCKFDVIVFLSFSAFEFVLAKYGKELFFTKVIVCFSKKMKNNIKKLVLKYQQIVYPEKASLESLAKFLIKENFNK